MNSDFTCRCGRAKPKSWHLVCPGCWHQMPRGLRTEVWEAYQECANSARHRGAIRACLEFLDGRGKGESKIGDLKFKI
jgi:hypothetical protein